MPDSTDSSIRDIASLATFCVSLLVLLRAQYIYQVEYRRTRVKEIETRLNEFYSPLLFYIRTVNHLYCELRCSTTSDICSKGFRMIPFLLQGKTFVGNEAALFSIILEAEKKIEDLIVSKSGLIDAANIDHHLDAEEESLKVKIDECIKRFEKKYKDNSFNKRERDFRTALELLLIHVRILRSASQGLFTGEEKRFTNFTYPQFLDPYIDARIKKLQVERENLNKTWFQRFMSYLDCVDDQLGRL